MKKILLSKALTTGAITVGALATIGGAGAIAAKYMAVSDGAKTLDSTAWSLGGQLGYSDKLEKGQENQWKRKALSLNENNKINYLALGDSVAAGYDAWRDIDGYGYTDFIHDELKTRGLLGEDYNKHTFTGITGEDMGSIIEGKMTQERWESTLNDHKYTNMPQYQTDNGKHVKFKDFTKKLDGQIKNANLITLNMGANDILGGIKVFGVSLHDIMNPVYLKKNHLVAEDVATKDAMGTFISKKVAEVKAKGIPYIAKHLGEIISINTKKLGEIVVNVGGYVNGVLAKIKRLNPNANVVVAGYYNPLANFGLISKLAGLDGLIDNLNLAIKNSSYTQNIKNDKFNVIYSDLSKMTENLSVAHNYDKTRSDSLEKGTKYGISDEILGVNSAKFIPHVLDIHPSLQGSVMMGKIIMNDYSKLTLAPGQVDDAVNNSLKGRNFAKNNAGSFLFSDTNTNGIYKTKPSFEMDATDLGNLDKDTFGANEHLFKTSYDEISKRPLPKDGNKDDELKYKGYQIGSVYVNSYQLIAEGMLKSLINSIIESLGDFAKNKIEDTLSTFKIVSKETIGLDAWADYVSMQGIYSHEDPLYVLLNIYATNLGESFSTSPTDKRTLLEALLDNLDASVVGSMKDGVGLLETLTANSNSLNAIIYPLKDNLIPLEDKNNLYAKALIGLSTDLQGWVFGMNYAPNKLDNTQRFWKNIYSFNMFGLNPATMDIPDMQIGITISIDSLSNSLFKQNITDSLLFIPLGAKTLAQFVAMGTTDRIGELFVTLKDMNGEKGQIKEYAEEKLAQLAHYNVIDSSTSYGIEHGLLAGLSDPDEVDKQIGEYLRKTFHEKDSEGNILYPASIYAPKKFKE